MEKLDAVERAQGVIVRARQAITRAQNATVRCRIALERLRIITGQCRADYQERRARTEENITRTEILMTVSTSRREARIEGSRRVCSLDLDRLPAIALSSPPIVSQKGSGEQQ
jgi:hypothetical protein